jgi:hypothetical protein
MASKKKPAKKAAKVRIDVAGLTNDLLVTHIKNVATSMQANNASFPSPPVPLATLSAAADKLAGSDANAKAARQKAVLATSQRDEDRAAAVAYFNKTAAYVQMQSDGDETVIRSGGFDVRAAPTRLTQLAIVDGLVALAASKSSQAALKWKKVTGAKGYEVQACADPPSDAGYKHADTCTATRLAVTGLATGARLWVRVRAVGARDIKGPWSDPATCVVQ